MANRNFANGGKQYSMRVAPVRLDCSFTVDATAAIGISNLDGPAISSVIMHSTHATPSALNPAAGNIVIRLQDNYNKYLVGKVQIRSPNSGSALTSTTAHAAYVITALGTASAAQWRAAGVPAGITPAVGVSFIALQTASIGGSAAVQIAAATGSGVAALEVLGQPNKSVAPDPAAANGIGSQLILQCRDYAGAIVQPADGSVISIEMVLNNSSVATSS